MSEEGPPPSVEEPASKPSPPPLRVHHLMLWTAATAVLMATSSLSSAEQDRSAARSGYLVIWGAACGAGLVVTVVGCVRLRRGLPFFHQPGHGLALVAVLSVLMNSVWWMTSNLLGLPQDVYRQAVYSSAFESGSYTLLALIAFFMAFRLADNWAWRAQFFLGALTALVIASHNLIYWLSQKWYWLYDVYIVGVPVVAWAMAPAAVGIPVVALVDWRRRERRDWTHWAVFLTASAGYLADTAFQLCRGYFGFL